MIKIFGNTITVKDWSTEGSIVLPEFHRGEIKGNICKIMLNFFHLKDFKTVKDLCFGMKVKSKSLRHPKVHAVLDLKDDFFVIQTD